MVMLLKVNSILSKAHTFTHSSILSGGYSLKESDGTTRVVEYTADKHHGFNAIVKKIGHAHHPHVYGHGNHGGAGYYAGGYGGW